MSHALHLADGDLVRYLDHELVGRDFRQTMQHLARCMTCEHRLEHIREQSDAASRLFDGERVLPGDSVRAEAWAAVEQAAWRSRRRAKAPALDRWRAAAVIALLMVGTVALHPPLRAWVTEQIAVLTGTVQPASPRVASLPEPPAAPKPLGSAVSFVPAGEVFSVEFDHAQRGGEIRVSVANVAAASAQEVGGTGAEMLVLPAALRIANDPASDADYVLVLPAGIQQLQIRVGSARVTAVSLRNRPQPWEGTFPLR